MSTKPPGCVCVINCMCGAEARNLRVQIGNLATILAGMARALERIDSRYVTVGECPACGQGNELATVHDPECPHQIAHVVLKAFRKTLPENVVVFKK